MKTNPPFTNCFPPPRLLGIAASFGAALALAITPAAGALPAFMRATGETQGEIRGDVAQAGREDSMEVLSFEQQVLAPYDAASGLPTGKRQHRPLKIIKRVDKASPLLMNVLVNNENLTDVRIEFFMPNRTTGTEVQFYTIELQNATIVSIRPWMPNTYDRTTSEYPVMEEIQFVYQKISWTIENGGITAQDDWNVPRAAATAEGAEE